MLLPAVLLVVSLLALLAYGYMVAIIFAVVSFWSWRVTGRGKRFPAVLTLIEDRAVEALRAGRAVDDAATELAERAFGSVDVNGRFLARADAIKSYDDAKARLLRTVAAYAHKSRSTEQARKIMERAESGYANWQKTKGDAGQNRITREELRLLESMARSGDVLSLFEKANGENWNRFRAIALRCKAWQEAVLKELIETGNPQSGDLVAYTLENDRYIMGGKRPRIVQWFYQFALGSDATHMAIMLRDEAGNATESHMWGTPSLYNRTRLAVGSFGNRFYRANAEMFVNKKFGPAIEKAYGESDWRQVVEREIRHSVEEWHCGKDEWFKQLRNTESHRVLVALVLNTLSCFQKPWRQRMLFKDDWIKRGTQVSCSEFVVKAALQSANVLGQRLSAKTGIPEEEIVAPRFNPRRRVARYSPGMLVHRVLKKGFCHELPSSPLFNALVV